MENLDKIFRRVEPTEEYKNLVRLHYFKGRIIDTNHRVDKYDVKSKRFTLTLPDIMPEALNNGLKESRVYQFHFNGKDEAVMTVPLSAKEKSTKWFLRRVERLKRKGLMKDKIELSVIHAIHTSCQDCIYSVEQGTTQIGCSFNDRIEKYKQAECVVEAQNECGEFYVVNGTTCLAKRTGQWAKNKKDWVTATSEEIKQKVDVIIPVDAFKESELLKTIQSVKAQTNRVNTLTVISKDKKSMPVLHKLMCDNAKGVDWYLSHSLESISENGLVDEAVQRLKGHFYTVFHQGSVIPSKFVENLNREVVHKLSKTMVYLPNKHGDGLTVALGFHRNPQISGNKPAIFGEGSKTIQLNSLAEKAKFLAKNHLITRMVSSVNKLCNPK